MNETHVPSYDNKSISMVPTQNDKVIILRYIHLDGKEQVKIGDNSIKCMCSCICIIHLNQ